MNLPQYRHAIAVAGEEYLRTCEDARERMLKALAVAHEKFFEDPDIVKADYPEENVERRRDQ